MSGAAFRLRRSVGKMTKLDHLEEVKVVTRSPLVNQRRDHYRSYSSYPFVNTTPLPRVASAVRSAGGMGCAPALAPPSPGPRRPRLTLNLQSGLYDLINLDKQVKTFNNGSLGSGIDEERSEMR